MYNLRFFLLFFIFDISYFYGNTEKYYFKHLGLEQGLSQSSVLCIMQDHTGFMWFGTKDGLNRYDETLSKYSSINMMIRHHSVTMLSILFLK